MDVTFIFWRLYKANTVHFIGGKAIEIFVIKVVTKKELITK